MKEKRPPASEQDLERMFGNLLRTGVVIAAIVVLTGGVLFLARYGNQKPEYQIFRGEPAQLRHVTDILKAAVELNRRGLIQLGLLFLIATPVARVAFAVAAFGWQRDGTYVVVALIVLSVLIYSLVGAYL
ncbi:MAG: DUF1634 domain-containing protein [Candidatus Omnitrophica bacterium]|nr:DUF1634 domain-containing protein [Candidatus Omnitrophota bacterium]